MGKSVIRIRHWTAADWRRVKAAATVSNVRPAVRRGTVLADVEGPAVPDAPEVVAVAEGRATTFHALFVE